MIRSLYAHQAWADSAMLIAAAGHDSAVSDESLRKRLHHIVAVQRAFLLLLTNRPIDYAAHARVPDSFAEVEQSFRQTHADELAWIAGVSEQKLAEPFSVPFFPSTKLTVADVLTQVVMHSQHHRGQVATRLRELGLQPPTVDYIIWLKDRPAPWQ